MDAATLADVMDNAMPLSYYRRELPMYEQAMRDANVTTVARARMWHAQIGHECVGLKYMAEIANGSAYDRYENPAGPWQGLGNVNAGDGRRYKGRGPIQLTGRHNYGACSAWAFGIGKVPTRTFFVDHPEQAETDRYKWLGTVWYWTVARSNLNALSDALNLLGATQAINGGYNGLPDRERRYQRIAHFGEQLLPTRPRPRKGHGDMKILVVSKAECARKKRPWPGYFKHDGYSLTHIKDGAELRALRVSGWPAARTISLWTYQQLGGH